jgi:hypothetical protein
MKKVNSDKVEEVAWLEESEKFGGSGRSISIALGRDPKSTDLMERHPFDVEITTVPPGKAAFPYHSHSEQWEFYHVIQEVASLEMKRESTQFRRTMPSSSNQEKRIRSSIPVRKTWSSMSSLTTP